MLVSGPALAVEPLMGVDLAMAPLPREPKVRLAGPAAGVAQSPNELAGRPSFEWLVESITLPSSLVDYKRHIEE